ncbi:hypothetical protein AVEN_159611-1 [Araneus ventricosus]|uniref:Uncharacterized protein n=1 Tax=Araneus ventricosus TaxID=182803 RepID=A0A4Y2PN77_ARAVE|nr:hypothetical protein AVEN_159611-1 [Araneus ventricosus]
MRCMDSARWIFSTYARHDSVFASQIKVGPGGAGTALLFLSASFFSSRSLKPLCLRQTTTSQPTIPVTDPKRVIPSSEGQLEGGKRNEILQCDQHGDNRGLVPSNSFRWGL